MGKRSMMRSQAALTSSAMMAIIDKHAAKTMYNVAHRAQQSNSGKEPMA